MQITQNKVKEAYGTKKDRTKKLNLTSIDVYLSTSEISDLIKELQRLKCEGKTKTGHHIHLWTHLSKIGL